MDTVAALAPMLRSSIGFDHFFRALDRAVKSQDQANYPPYNIEKTSEEAYRLTLAVAGWSPADLTVTSAPRLLVVSGRKPADEKRYLYRRIPSGAFELRFDLADDVRVREARMTNGLLVIELARVMREAAPPRRIPITQAKGRDAVRGSAGLRLVQSPGNVGSQRRATA